MGDAARIVSIAGLEASRCQPEVGSNSWQAFEAGWLVDRSLKAQRRHVSDQLAE